jgi:hypothetical protein
MSNKYKGEVDLEIGGQVRKIKFTTNSACMMEEYTGKSFADYFSDGGASMGLIRNAIYFSLQSFKYNKRITIHQVGDWIDAEMRESEDALSVFGEAIGRAVSYYFDPTQEKREAEEAKSPPLDGMQEGDPRD